MTVRDRVRAVMPAESTIDLDAHADRVAVTVAAARRACRVAEGRKQPRTRAAGNPDPNLIVWPPC